MDYEWISLHYYNLLDCFVFDKSVVWPGSWKIAADNPAGRRRPRYRAYAPPGSRRFERWQVLFHRLIIMVRALQAWWPHCFFWCAHSLSIIVINEVECSSSLLVLLIHEWKEIGCPASWRLYLRAINSWVRNFVQLVDYLNPINADTDLAATCVSVFEAKLNFV